MYRMYITVLYHIEQSFQLKHFQKIFLLFFFSWEEQKLYYIKLLTNGTKQKTILYIFFYNMRQNPDPQ